MPQEFLNPDRMLPSDPSERSVARRLYDHVAELPIISPHGHTDPRWFASDEPFSDAASLFLTPDHYVLRMMRSQGISYDALGVPRKDGGKVAEPREAWRLFADNFHLFDGTPSKIWTDHAMHWGFGITASLSPENADEYFDLINSRLSTPELLPMAILDKANVEAITTTEFALDPLVAHQAMAAAGKIGRIRTTYRPDDVTNPDLPGFAANLERLAEMTGQDTGDWGGMIEAHRIRRAHFRLHGATATDHGMPTAGTADLAPAEKQALLTRVLGAEVSADDAELFRAQMMTEMAGLSVEDGMVMQFHAGSKRNTDPEMMAARGADMGADIPRRVDPVHGLQALLAKYGGAPGFRLIFFCLDESVYARELAPMAGYWPALYLGPPWWFHDSQRGIIRYLDSVVESAGFANLAGFNDDTRALLSIPARHDVWRRCVSAFLSQMVVQKTLSFSRACELADQLSYSSAKRLYNLGD